MTPELFPWLGEPDLLITCVYSLAIKIACVVFCFLFCVFYVIQNKNSSYCIYFCHFAIPKEIMFSLKWFP